MRGNWRRVQYLISSIQQPTFNVQGSRQEELARGCFGDFSSSFLPLILGDWMLEIGCWIKSTHGVRCSGPVACPRPNMQSAENAATIPWPYGRRIVADFGHMKVARVWVGDLFLAWGEAARVCRGVADWCGFLSCSPAAGRGRETAGASSRGPGEGARRSQAWGSSSGRSDGEAFPHRAI